jgi:hypothetical protein
MSFMEILIRARDFLLTCFSLNVLTGLIPAFLLAGALAVFVSRALVLKYPGAKTNKFVSYSIATVAGIVFSVCSCTAIPLFAGIRKTGAGLCPAIEVKKYESLSAEGEKYSIILTPAIVINDKVVAAGRGTAEKDLERMVRTAYNA